MAKVNFDTDKIIRHYQTELEKAMKRAVLMIEADAKKNAPVDTGRLRTSITNVVDRVANDVIRGRVGSNLSYAKYQEFGTSKMPAQSYLRPALEKNFDKIIKMLRRAI